MDRDRPTLIGLDKFVALNGHPSEWAWPTHLQIPPSSLSTQLFLTALMQCPPESLSNDLWEMRRLAKAPAPAPAQAHAQVEVGAPSQDKQLTFDGCVTRAFKCCLAQVYLAKRSCGPLGRGQLWFDRPSGMRRLIVIDNRMDSGQCLLCLCWPSIN